MHGMLELVVFVRRPVDGLPEPERDNLGRLFYKIDGLVLPEDISPGLKEQADGYVVRCSTAPNSHLIHQVNEQRGEGTISTGVFVEVFSTHYQYVCELFAQIMRDVRDAIARDAAANRAHTEALERFAAGMRPHTDAMQLLARTMSVGSHRH